MTVDTERQREKLVGEICTMLAKMGRVRDFLHLEQRFALAEQMRDIADHLDAGKVLRPRPVGPAVRPARRLVRSTEHDSDGAPLYRLNSW
jgi:hypothetical protein